ncbi:vanadium-dependent haloperoxidase [Rubrobacter aplysinae]|uniref:vanadium-dependent haloperoxidase n=1 Tax=Rubrobacter aplysinae TaxID=909625 RepID=UPI00064BCE2B|nr:vanadium-dependent haloperoxidase [Rubrobacter aplysinae]
MGSRRDKALEIRRGAAGIAASRSHPEHRGNGDEQRYRRDVNRNGTERNEPSYIGNFTKCLPHDAEGFVLDPRDYEEWVRAIDSGDPRDFRGLRIGPGPFQAHGDFEYKPDGTPQLNWSASYQGLPDGPGVRAWESQGAGLTYDLEGPDAQAVTMPPCPSLESQELIAEMGEVYWQALCRDVPFANWDSDSTIDAARNSLKRLWWFRRDQTLNLDGTTDVLPESLARRRILSEDGSDAVPKEKLFRGVAPGEQEGPYLSQFLLIGNGGINSGDTAHTISDGMISYGALRTDQRVRVATSDDYLTDWGEWLDVQNGADTRGRESYASGSSGYRFIATPRDLATYVHYDALYEAYLNACLILLGLKAPFDPGLPFRGPDYIDKQQGFAQFGGPHILTLLTEVATRALKAVRYQKFNVHRRLRPEAVGGWMYQRQNGGPVTRQRLATLENMQNAFAGSSGIGLRLDTANGANGNWLLPMAFPEGSPAHPSYGAGHATVAGACVTLLKAWFDSGWELEDGSGNPIAYEPLSDGSALADVSGTLTAPLTVEGELNKVGANIAIGRDWAGVHYYTDYYESFRMGEQVAVGLLEEQRLTYQENFSLTVPLFDGSAVRV